MKSSIGAPHLRRFSSAVVFAGIAAEAGLDVSRVPDLDPASDLSPVFASR